MKTTLAIAWSIAVVSLVGCGAERDECADGACRPLLGEGPDEPAADPTIDARTCEALCARLDFDCGVLGEDACMALCAQPGFDRYELICLAQECGPAGLKQCFDAEIDDGRSDAVPFDPRF